MLAGLVAQRMLITNLRPPTTETEPLHHLVDTLAEVSADQVPEVAHIYRALHALLPELDKHNEAGADEQQELCLSAARAMTNLHRVERPLAVDLRLNGEVTIPTAVTREAARAAAALTRLAPHPSGSPSWRDFHRRFCERYGIGALVPVSELVDLDSGLGYPAGYRGSHRTTPAAGVSDRDLTLLRWAQQSALMGTEIVLDDTMIARLAVGDPDEYRVQPHTELRFRIPPRPRTPSLQETSSSRSPVGHEQPERPQVAFSTCSPTKTATECAMPTRTCRRSARARYRFRFTARRPNCGPTT